MAANNFNIHDCLNEVEQEIGNDPNELHALLGDNFLNLTNTCCPSSPLDWNAIANKTVIDINAMEEGYKNLQRCVNTCNETAQSIITELEAINARKEDAHRIVTDINKEDVSITARKEDALRILAEITKDEEAITARKEDALHMLVEVSKEQVLMITKKDEALRILDNEKAKLLSIEQDILKNKATVAKIRLEAEQEEQRKKEADQKLIELEVIRQREVRESREKAIQEATVVVNDLVRNNVISLEEEEDTDDEAFKEWAGEGDDEDDVAITKEALQGALQVFGVMIEQQLQKNVTAIKEGVSEEEEEMEIENEVTMESSWTTDEQSRNDFIAWGEQFTTTQKLFIIQSYGKGLLA